MAKNPKKRRATDQLTPNNIHEDKEEHAENYEDEPLIQRAVMTRKQGISREDLRGIFGKKKEVKKERNELLKAQEHSQNESKQHEEIIESQEIKTSTDPMSGLNKSFLKAVTQTINKQSDKNLKFLFLQYKKFIEGIEKGEYNKTKINE
ncbi:hypothetical protein NUSPORA_00144 [Nucleospora cyclopteri]